MITVRQLLTCLVLGVSAACAAVDLPWGEPPFVPPAGHPRVLLRPDDLARVRAEREDPALAASWSELRRRSYLPGDYTPEPRYDLAVMQAAEATAFRGMVEDDPALKRRAIELAFTLLGTEGPAADPGYFEMIVVGRCLRAVAAVHDWCHDALTPDERLRLCALLREHATVMEIKFPPTTPNSIAGHSSEDQLLWNQLAMAIATYDEDPDIYRLVAGRFYREYTAPRDFHYAGHFHHQGNSYGFGRFGADVGAALLLDGMDAPEPWSLASMSQVPYYFLYLRRPDGGLIADGDVYLSSTRPTGSYWAPPAHLWLHFTALFRDPQFAAQWRRQLDTVETKLQWQHDPVDPILTILRRPDRVKKGDLEQLPLSRYFPEPLGAIIARTGWDIGPASRDTVAYLKIGTHRFGNHQHADSGQFQLFYRGSLAIDSGLYQSADTRYGGPHFRNYYQQAIAHNTLLIEEPGEEFLSDGDAVANHAGQRGLDGARTMEEFWEQDSRTGRVLARFIGPNPVAPEVSLITGDLTPAYSATKARNVTRTMAFLPLEGTDVPAVLIVWDRVASVRPDQRKVALLHSMEEPRIENNITIITRTGGQVEVLRWPPVAITRQHERAAEATLRFDLRPLAARRIVKAELSCRTPWSRQGQLEVWADGAKVADVSLADAEPLPTPDITAWLQAARDAGRTTVELTVRRVGGDSRGVLYTPEGPHAPHLRLWVEAEPCGGKLVQTTLLPAGENLELRKIGGPGSEFLAGGKNWTATPRIADPMAGNEAGAWRVEIGGRSGATATRFLNVYQVMDAETPPLPVRLVRGDGVIGAACGGRLFLASDTNEPVASGAAFTIDAADAGDDGQALVILTGLPAGDHSLWQGDALRAAAAVEPFSHTWVVALRPGTYTLRSR